MLALPASPARPRPRMLLVGTSIAISGVAMLVAGQLGAYLNLRERAGALASKLSIVTVVVAGTFAVWAQVAYSRNTWTWAAVVLAAVALVGVVLATRMRREGWAFLLSAVAIVGAVVLIFGSLYPNVMPAFDAANSLTVTNA